MKRVQAHVRINTVEAIHAALDAIGVRGMTCEPVRGYGRQQGQTATFQGSHYALNLVPKTRIDIVVPDDRAEDVIEAIIAATRTGELGDGKIFVSEVLEAVRIRTGETGNDAVS